VNIDKLFTRPVTNVLFVDPGVSGTGLATFDRIPSTHPQILQYKVLKAKASLDWTEKCDSIWNNFETYLMERPLRLIVMEFPALWSGSGLSYASAETGDLFKLTYIIGGFGRIAQHGYVPIALVSPQEWKGNLPKTVIEQRVLKHYPDTFPENKVPNHACDSIGMGLAANRML